MIRRILLLLALFVATASSQQRDPTPAPSDEIPPFKPRFNLPKKMPWGDKFRQPPTLRREPKSRVSKTCSIPLIDVTPPVKPFMPNLQPKTPTNDRIAIPPPAPACEGDPEERR